MSKTIDILVTVDAQSIMSQYPNASTDENNPTMINPNFVYMFASTNALSGNGTGDLAISAQVGDSVNFSCITISNNSVNSAFIYDIQRVAGSDVFSQFTSSMLNLSTLEPSVPDALPPALTNQKFWKFGANVISLGSERYTANFALYEGISGSNPQLVGYFTWDPKIVVTG